MSRKHDSLVPKPNPECNICHYTFSIKEVLAMHMHKVHKGAAPVQKSSDMCLFTYHLSCILKSHINRKHICILKYFIVISVIFLQREKMWLSIMNILSTKKTMLTCELCGYRISNAQYKKSHMQALCQADYSWNICIFRFLGLICHGL